MQISMNGQTELHDLGEGSMFRSWGRFFEGVNGKTDYWINARLATNDGVISNEIDEGVVRFSNADPEANQPAGITMLVDGALQPVVPDTPEWAEVDSMLNVLELASARETVDTATILLNN